MAPSLRIDVELPIVKKVDAAEAGFDRRLEDVPRILHPVHVADFVAVKRRDRQFRDAQFPSTNWMMISVSKWKSFVFFSNGICASAAVE